jgi:hypothetical protein
VPVSNRGARLREQRGAVLDALAAPDENQALVEVEILATELATLADR